MKAKRTVPFIFAGISIMLIGSCASTGQFLPIAPDENVIGTIQITFAAHDWKAGVHTPSLRTVQVIHFAHDIERHGYQGMYPSQYNKFPIQRRYLALQGEVLHWDMVDNINTKAEVLGYLEAALEENNTETLFDVLGAIARSKGMAALARELGLNRESLYRSLSPEGNPSFATVARVLDKLGFQLSIKRKVPA